MGQKQSWPAPGSPEFDSIPVDGNADVTSVLRLVRQEHKVPAIAAALVTSEGVSKVGAVGVRKLGSPIPATQDDIWHLGSNTKAFTAVLAGVFVEDGKLCWNTTLGELFPHRLNGHLLWGVTLEHLLSHHSGLPANLDDWHSLSAVQSTMEQRLKALELAKHCKLMPSGEAYVYSNLGYVLAGAMLEQVGGQPWEDLLRIHVGGPLGMGSVGFGGTGTEGEVDQPWPHLEGGQPAPDVRTVGGDLRIPTALGDFRSNAFYLSSITVWRSLDHMTLHRLPLSFLHTIFSFLLSFPHPRGQNGPSMDNPAVMSPAGCVHCTISDWGCFIADQLRGARGEEALLQPDTYKKLHGCHVEGSPGAIFRLIPC